MQNFVKIVIILFLGLQISSLGAQDSDLGTQVIDWILPEDSPGAKGDVYRFLRNPSNLTITFGYAWMSYFSLLGSFYDTNESDQVAAETNQIGHRTDGLNTLRLGFQFGNSYLDVKVSPRWGGTRNLTQVNDYYDPPVVTTLATYAPNQAFLIDARTGYTYEPEIDGDLYYRLSIEFYGTYLSLMNPIALGTRNHQQVLALGGGYGMVMVGVGAPVQIVLPLVLGYDPFPRLDIKLGFLTRFGVLIPGELAGELQLMGPDFDLWLNEGLSLYTEFRVFKFQWGFMAHGFNQLEIGFRIKL